jgi:hypothetical protein
MTPETTPTTVSSPTADVLTPPEVPRRRVALDVAGSDLMLRGHFSDWESGLSIGPDLDRVGLRLAIDATSAEAALPGGEQAPDLFSFTSRQVERMGVGAFRADGVLTGALGPRPVEMLIETPPGHTALFVLSFAANRSDFGDGWGDLIQNVVPFGERDGGGPVRLAHAWLTPPVLAAA